MRTKPLASVLIALSVPALGGAAYAVTQSINTRPEPTVVLPNTTTSTPEHHRGHTTATTADHRGDDRLVVPTTVDDRGHDGTTVDDHRHGATGTTDATEPHDVNDDNGHDAADDDAHDANEHHGTSPTTMPASPTTIDDHGHDAPAPTPTTAGDGDQGHDGGHDGRGNDGPGSGSGQGSGGGGHDG